MPSLFRACSAKDVISKGKLNTSGPVVWFREDVMNDLTPDLSGGLFFAFQHQYSGYKWGEKKRKSSDAGQ